MVKPVFLVAGASSGMGRETALKLGKSQAHVILAARRIGPLEEAAEKIRQTGGSAEAMTFDGNDLQSVEALIKRIETNHGQLNGAFNNIGHTFGDSPLHETPLERWQNALQINLSAVFYLMRAQVSLMLRNGGGRIVNNSSTGGLRGTRNMSDYSAAKWGVIGLTKSAALEYANKNIIINVIAPGIIATEKFREFEQRTPEVFENLQRETPIGRFGEMQEIADVVDWLLREAPAYLAGTVIPIDGGRTA